MVGGLRRENAHENYDNIEGGNFGISSDCVYGDISAAKERMYRTLHV